MCRAFKDVFEMVNESILLHEFSFQEYKVQISEK